jgi:ADP-heptose:LPS heptosyltransferase
MALIEKPSTEGLMPGTRMSLDSMEIPSFRYLLAEQNKTLKNILIKTPYALGDCICSEPAIRYAKKHFKGSNISIITPFPEVFRHIGFHDLFDLNLERKPEWHNYFVMECYHSADALQSEFVHNFNMAIEDYICVSLFKGMIPVADRNIVIRPSAIERDYVKSQQIVIHAGKHWISKTFPKRWWDKVISTLHNAGISPTLIGAKVDDGKRGYVEVDSSKCLDLRDKLTVMESAAVLQRAQIVLTNDSAPLHMAASGDAFIGFLSTVRHPDFVGHWRPDSSGKNTWMHKMENLSRGHLWQDSDVSPTKNGGKYDVIDFETMMTWLPEPETVATWALGKLSGRN